MPQEPLGTPLGYPQAVPNLPRGCLRVPEAPRRVPRALPSGPRGASEGPQATPRASGSSQTLSKLRFFANPDHWGMITEKFLSVPESSCQCLTAPASS